MVNRYAKNLMKAAVILAFGSSVNADTVTLNSLDGSLSISGDLVDFSSDFYIISSSVGNLSIATASVECIGDTCPSIMPDFTEFTISGSRELSLNLMPSVLDGFADSLGLDITNQIDDNGNPQVLFSDENGIDVASISFVMRGSSNGLRGLAEGTASLALTTRPVRQAEADAFARSGFGDIRSEGLETILALDGMVIVTSSENKVHIVRQSDIAKIFSGEITNWSEIGGSDAPINLYVRPENSGTGSVFSQLIMRPARTGFTLRVNLMESDTAVADAVSADPNGIGFTSFANAGNAEPAALLGACGIQSPATAFTIQAEEYPYARRMYLYKGTQNVPVLVDLLLDYLATDEAQQLIGFSGYVDQGISEVPVNNQGLRFLSASLSTGAEMTLEQLQALNSELSTAQRATITYRFEQGTSQLDSRAETDIQRLINKFEDDNFGDKQILLLGFTDSVGEGSVNQSLSLARANQVRNALLAASGGSIDPSRIEVRGYGELSPLGCNEDIEGRRINRRVEVWTR